MAKKIKKRHSGLKFIRFFIISGVIVFVVGALSNRLVFFLTHEDLFKIQAVVVDPALKDMNINSASLERLKGKNIFKVNLGAIQDEMRRQYPTVDQLRLIRHFPDKIYVAAQHRKPFAFVDNQGRRVVVDRNGIVVAAPFMSNLRLPVISGVNVKMDVAVGKSLGQREIIVALSIIRAIQTNEDLKTFFVTSMDLSNLSSINFQLSNQMKIIIDDDKIYPKIRKLGILLAQGHIDFKNYRYIDLRFEEPILGKNEKTTP